jgi:hypothetical protein
MKRFEAELLLKDDWTQVRPEVKSKEPSHFGGRGNFLCRTDGRQEKEKAIRSRFSKAWKRP